MFPASQKRTVFRRRFTVITRIVATVIVLILAFGAFWLNPGDAASIFAGIILLLFAGVIWFKWDLLRDAFRAGRTSYLAPGQRRVGSGSVSPISRGGSNEIRGISIAMRPPARRSASPGQ